MAIISPLMLGFLGTKYQWPSAMVLYWFSFNVFTMAQQFYLLKRYHQPLSMLDNEHVVTDVAVVDAEGSAKAGIAPTNGSTRAKSIGKKKKGAKK